ncbi:MAG: NAD(P)-binding domain-containing protein [Candidatus Aenigmatarchaeota archaeon]
MALNIRTIGIDGGGRFATALAQALSYREEVEKILMYIRDEKRVNYINKKRKNITYFSNVELDKKISATADLSEIGKTDLIFLVVPTEDVEKAVLDLKSHYNQQPLINTNKGLEKKGRLAHEIIFDVLGEIPLLHMTGAALADEIIYGYPSCNQLAAFDFSLAKSIAEQLTTKNFILKPCDDLIGAELVGSFKNLVMVILGIADTRYNHSQNVRGALIGESLRELNILRQHLGSNPNNSLEISFGDFYLTKSRNYQFGRDFATEKIFYGRFNPIAQFSNLKARLRRRKYRNYISEVRETYEEIVKLFASGVHELINGAEKVLTAKMSGAYSHNPTSETLEGYRSIVPFYLIANKLGVMNELFIVDALYKIFYEGKNEKEVIDQILIKIGKTE